jgi:hypothetical protein
MLIPKHLIIGREEILFRFFIKIYKVFGYCADTLHYFHPIAQNLNIKMPVYSAGWLDFVSQEPINMMSKSYSNFITNAQYRAYVRTQV